MRRLSLSAKDKRWKALVQAAKAVELEFPGFKVTVAESIKLLQRKEFA